MKVIGVVQWTNRDKNGTPIAGVVPLLESQKKAWRTIDAAEEFPSQGQVFWFAAHTAVPDALVKFRAEPNPGQRDEFKVVDPETVLEVLDLRRFGNPTEVRTALVDGLRVPGPLGAARALVLCKPNVLVGPVDVSRAPDSTVKLGGATHPRLSLYAGASLRPIVINGRERLVRVEESAPLGFVDWDDDAIVLKRAIEVAVRVAKQAGRDTGQTKKQIEDAARALASQGLGPEAQLNSYRLERALALIDKTDVVTRTAGELADLLLAHPAIKAQLDKLSAQVAADVEKSVHADLERQLAAQRTALRETTEARDLMKSQLEVIEQEVRAAETAVAARVRAALDRPLDLLAEVSVLRPFLNSGSPRVRGSAPTIPTSANVDWSGSGSEDIKDKASLRRSLTSAARARGVDPALLLQIHAATAAGLMPVTLGPVALTALTAYALGACGGRFLIVHVSPSAIQPQDFDEAPGGGVVAAAGAARDIDGISLVLLEGANRSPLEASVVPLLQLREIGLSPVASARGLRLAASLVTGATTVPVTPQLWSHAVAFSPEPTSSLMQTAVLGDITLSSELFALGDEPTGVIDALAEAWPDCLELRPTMSRFGSALTRLYEDEPRISEALLSGLILPYVATALTPEEQAEALSKAKDEDGALALALRRLRKRLT